MTLGNDNGTDGQTDRQTDRQTDGQRECDAICGPSWGGGPHKNPDRHTKKMERIIYAYACLF